MNSIFSEGYWQKKKSIIERAKLRPSLASSKLIIENEQKRIRKKDVEVIFSSQNRTIDDLGQLGESVFIVTTIFEDTDYYPQTIGSVLNLETCDIPIIYFIKEASKTQKCRDIVRSAISDIGIEDKDLTILYCWMSDNSMYQGLGQAFEFISNNHGCETSLMTYINGDDVLEQTSVSNVLNLTRATGARWMTGTSQVIDEDGNLLFSHKILFDQDDMKRGLHVGGRYPFVMQEGTFWSLSIYREIDGFNQSLSLAGDYDLWLQFSQIEPLVSTGKPNAAFRRRAGQKSEDLDSYMEEMAICRKNRGLDYDLDSWLKLIQADVSNDLVPIHSGFKISPLSDRSVGYHYVHQDKFKPHLRKPNDDPLFSYPIDLSILETRYQSKLLIQQALDHDSHDKHHGIVNLGLDPDTHGFFTYYLLRAKQKSRFDLKSTEQCLGIIRIRIVAIGAEKMSTLAINCNGRQRQYALRPLDSKFTCQDVYEDYYICEYLSPNSIFDVTIVGCSWAYLSVHRNHTPLPSSFGFYGDIHPSLGGWPYITRIIPPIIDNKVNNEIPLISVIIPTYNQADTIRDTLTSIFNQGYSRLQVILLDGLSTDETRTVISDFLPLLSECISAPDGGQSEAIAKGLELAKGEIITWLNSDDMYFPFCLQLVAMSYLETSADLLVGNCLVFKKGEYSFIHSPNISNGKLMPSEILDISNYWLKGKYFHQPEVFFTRSALDKVEKKTREKCINLALYYSMDFDLWAKMAIAHCSIERINAVLAIYRMTEVQKTSDISNYLPELTAHSCYLRDLFGVEITSHPKNRLESWHDLHVLLFNDIGFFGGAGVAHERIAKSLSSYGIQTTCIAVSDYWVDEGHSIDMERLRNLISELNPQIILCGNIHGIRCEHQILLRLLSESAPCFFIAHDFWITNGKAPYPTLDPLNPLGGIKSSDSSWIDSINHLQNLHIIPNSRFCENVLSRSGLRNIITGSDFVLCDGSISEFRQKWLSEHIVNIDERKTKILMGSIGLSEERKGVHLVTEALSSLHPNTLAQMSIGTYGYTPIDVISNYCEYRHHGFIESGKMPALLSEYDIFISASLIETFGQTALEAIGLGKITLITESGGHTEYAINEKNSLIIEPSAEAMASMLNSLINGANQTHDKLLPLNPIGRCLTVARFSHERQGSALLKIFDNILGGVLPAGGQRVSLETPAEHLVIICK